MISTPLLAVTFTALARQATAISVSGSAEGFASSVTGGGDATPVYPTTNDELVSYLGDAEARVIVLQQTFDFTGTEGTTKATGCAPWGKASACQLAINQDDWCKIYQPNAPSVGVKYDTAGVLGITVASDKTIIGDGTSGVIIGKGLRITHGASNVIIQNIKITDINPKYVWGGDAITLSDCDLVWIDHVTTSLIGRQHIVLGTAASGRVTISNCDIDGKTTYSATCDGYHYWNTFFDGSDDLVTFQNNFIHHFSGRAPKVAGKTLLHAVNNYWYGTSPTGHGFEIDSGGMVLAEGNVFQNVATVVEDRWEGEGFTSPDASTNEACETYIGRACLTNGFRSSGTFDITNTDFLVDFEGHDVASATTYGDARSVVDSAGFGTL